MNKCETVRKQAEDLFLACDETQKEGIAEHLATCPDCLNEVARIYGQSKVLEEADNKSELGHYSEAYLASLLRRTKEDDVLSLINEHVKSCHQCMETYDELLAKREENADLFREAPEQYLK